MTQIRKLPLDQLGFNFVDERHLPPGADEYLFRNQEHNEVFGAGRTYRALTPAEIEILENQGNTADDWKNIQVRAGFNPDLVKRCNFYGWNRIGRLTSSFISFRNLRMPVGLYNSTICSCDIGDDIVISNVHFMAHQIVGNNVMLIDIHELSISPEAKFGNGILKDEEDEETRIWLEVCNENGGRKILPFEGMLPGDAFLWSKYRDDKVLMQRFATLTEKRFDTHRGHYGVIGAQTVIKYCKTIKNTKIGEAAYIKGANKLKNLTINSSEKEKTQIGEGCELVNGIVGYGCRIFYGVKAVRFVMAPHSNLKYGARLINSYLGSNATISCCEVLNSLIYSSHEQHHNNSFLCSALVMGQSNLAAGANIGSNHNSRSADGEIIAKRGFWPGLSVSLKHNSKFGSFSLISKGDYPYEINLSFPFTLLIHDFSRDKLTVMPGYWFMYNMYALARNVWKFPHRDERTKKIHHIEYDFLAPDTIEEMFAALKTMEKCTGMAAVTDKGEKSYTEEELMNIGRKLLLESPEKVKALKIYCEEIENSKRKVELIKLDKAYPIFERMIVYYGIREILEAFESQDMRSYIDLQALFSKPKKSNWVNLGGQLVPSSEIEVLKNDVKSGVLDSWFAIHERYKVLGEAYSDQKLQHAAWALLKIKNKEGAKVDIADFRVWVEAYLQTTDWILQQVKTSREKDYQNAFRKMPYDNMKEMEAVVGEYGEDSFIAVAEAENKAAHNQARRILNEL